MRINAIWYPVRQWAEAKRFYGELLGLKLTQCNDEAGWAAFDVGGPPLFLVRNPERAGVPGGAAATLEPADLPGKVAQLRAAGVRVEEGLEGRIFTIFDPDGNLLELSAPVK